MREFRCFGPPGTGKTTWLAEQVRRSLEIRYFPNEVYCASFTRAGALELAGRDTGLPRKNIGTIHSLCWQYLDRPKIADADRKLMKAWDEANPAWKLKAPDAADPYGGGGVGLLARYSRARQTDGEMTHPFVDAWEDFKRETGSLDFTDLLLQAPDALDGARMLVVDEAQDMTPLQWRIVRRWGEQCDTFLVAGDDDQVLYEFLGASPDPFLEPIPKEQTRVISRSHRLPQAVHKWAEDWICDVSARWPKEYSPRDEQGALDAYSRPLGPAVAEEAAEITESGKRVMLLASCAYMIRPVVAHLKRLAVPYANPYRVERGDWNPLRKTARRAAAFLDEDRRLDPDAVLEWMKIIGSKGALRRGARKQLPLLAPQYHMPEDYGRWLRELDRWFVPGAADAMTEDPAGWLKTHLASAVRDRAEWILAVYKRGGIKALTERPRLVVGTIHSVKGGEADVVFLAPDLSWQANEEMRCKGIPAFDSIRRMFYVGGTRAKERLVLLAPSGRLATRW